MPPLNSTPHTKRVKGGAHGYAPYARRNKESTSDTTKLMPLDIVCDMEGTIASRKEARKKSKKVRFHQRGELKFGEFGDASVVFPAPAKEPSTPPRRVSFAGDLFEEVPTHSPFLEELELPIQRNNRKPDVGYLTYGDLLTRIKGLESAVQQQTSTISDLQGRCYDLEKMNADMKIEVAKLRGESPDEGSSRNRTFETVRLQTPKKPRFGIIPDVVDEDRPMDDVFEQQMASSSSGYDRPTMERSDSSSSVLVFPSSSPSSDASEIETPNDSPYGVNRVIDENYDEGLEEYHQQNRRRQFAMDVNKSLGIQDSMDSDQILDRIAESIPRVWNIKEEGPKDKFVGGLELTFPSLPIPPSLPF